MALPFAFAQDVAARWRTLTSDEATRADTLAADASDMIRDRWPDVDDRVRDGRLSYTSLSRVVAYMVIRAMNRPADSDGVSQQSETVGPFSASRTFSNPNGNLFFSAEDLRLLEPDAPRFKVGWLL